LTFDSSKFLLFVSIKFSSITEIVESTNNCFWWGKSFLVDNMLIDFVIFLAGNGYGKN